MQMGAQQLYIFGVAWNYGPYQCDKEKTNFRLVSIHQLPQKIACATGIFFCQASLPKSIMQSVFELKWLKKIGKNRNKSKIGLLLYHSHIDWVEVDIEAEVVSRLKLKWGWSWDFCWDED